jgi:hypothetical protein
VHALWLNDLEALEAITQDDYTRRLFLRMAQLSQTGRVTPFLRELHGDGDLDSETKERLAEIAEDAEFLHAVEEYVHRTRALH